MIAELEPISTHHGAIRPSTCYPCLRRARRSPAWRATRRNSTLEDIVDDRAPILGRSVRKRPCFEADHDVWATLLSHDFKYGERSAYLNKAVRTYESPAFLLVHPTDVAEAAQGFEQLVDSCHQELVLVGNRLFQVLREAEDRIRVLLRRRPIKVTFICTHPNRKRTQAFYRVLQHQLAGDAARLEALLEEGRSSSATLAKMRIDATAGGGLIEVYWCLEAPMCGLTIADPGISTSRMHVHLFDTLSVHGHQSPYLVADASTDQGMRAQTLLNRYVTALKGRSELLSVEALEALAAQGEY